MTELKNFVRRYTSISAVIGILRAKSCRSSTPKTGTTATTVII